METKTVKNIAELNGCAHKVLLECIAKDSARVLALSGNLGAGKTAFTKALAQALGVVEEVTSPTFVIMKSYVVPQHALFKTLTHIDAYRIESDDEMRVLGFKELIQDPARLICVEWPERIKAIMPTDAFPIHIEIETDEVRRITYGI